MNRPTLNAFTPLGEMIVQKYERYLPNAFDENLSLLEKVNKVIEYLNTIGKLTNDVVAKWNEVMQWILDDGLEEAVVAQLNVWLNDGTLATIINETIFNDLNTKVNGLLGKVGYGLVDYPRLEGETDDTGRFQRMFDDSQEKGVFVIPEGEYLVGSKDLIMPSNVILIGRGAKTIIKTIPNANPLNGIFFADGKTNIELYNISFDGNLDNQTTPHPMFRFRNSTHITIRNCSFTGQYGTFLILSGSKYGIVDNCIFNNVDGEVSSPGEVIYAQGVKNFNFSNLIAYDIGDHMFYFDSNSENGYGEYCDFVNCRGINCGFNGLTTGEVFKIANDNRRFTFTNCHAISSRMGFYFRENSGAGLSPTDYMLNNCSAENCNYGSGFYFAGVSGGIRSVTNAKISACVSKNNREVKGAGSAHGFRIENLKGITFTDCDALLNGRNGFMYANCEDVVHTGGRVEDNAKDGDSAGVKAGGNSSQNCDNMRFINITSLRSGNLQPVAILLGTTNVRVIGGNFDTTILMQDGTGAYRPTDNKAVVQVKGDGTYTVRGSAGLIASVLSDTYGIRINFKNLPTIVEPVVVPFNDSSAGGLAVGATPIAYNYIRSTDATACIIGLKAVASQTETHKQWSNADSGSLSFLVII